MTQEQNPAENSDEPRQPDIEVYIKDVAVGAIIDWLNTVFDSAEPQSSLDKPSITVHCHKGKLCIPLTIYIAAAGKQYTSLWFQSDQTPWGTDIDCATDIVEKLGNEVRCSTGAWAESEDSETQWWKVTSEGKEVVSWG